MDIKSIALVASTLVLSTSVDAAPVIPESFSIGLNTGYSITDTYDVSGSVDWFVFDSNGIDSISFYFDRTVAELDLVAGLYLGDTTGFDYAAAGAGEGSPYAHNAAHFYNSNLNIIDIFDDEHENTLGGPYGDPDFDLVLAAGRYSLALTTYDAAGSYQFTFTSSVSAVPVPAAVWLFGSGLIGLVGVARRKKS